MCFNDRIAIFATNPFSLWFYSFKAIASKTPTKNSSNVSHSRMLRTRPRIQRGGTHPRCPEGWTKEGCGTPAFVRPVETRVFGLPRHGNTHVGPEAHTCLHVLIPFSFWRFSLSLSLSLFPVTRPLLSLPLPTLLPSLPPLLFGQNQTNLVVHLRLCQPSSTHPVIWILSIFRTSPALPHPSAIHRRPTSLPTAFLHPLLHPRYYSLNRLVFDVTLTHPSFFPARLFRALFLIRHCYQRASYP